MEQEPKKITDRQVSETSIGPVCMSKTEYTMYIQTDYDFVL